MLFQELLELKNQLKIDTVEIFGSGPSVSLAQNLKLKSIKIAVGDLPWRAPKLGPFDIWMTNNTYFPLPWRKKDLKRIIKSNSLTLISSQSVNGKYNESQIKEILLKLFQLQNVSNLIFYDCIHFQKQKISHVEQNCCSFMNFLNIDKSIQDYFIESTKYQITAEQYKIGHGSTNALMLALIMKFKNVYVHGIELPEKMGDYKHYKNWKIPTNNLKLRILIYYQQYINRKLKTDFADKTREILLEEFNLLGKVAEKMGVKIYVTNNNSPLLSLNNFYPINQS